MHAKSAFIYGPMTSRKGVWVGREFPNVGTYKAYRLRGDNTQVEGCRLAGQDKCTVDRQFPAH